MVETDKLTETYAIRVPEVTKAAIDRLDSKQKKSMNEAVLIAIARALHDARFNPDLYLKDA